MSLDKVTGTALKILYLVVVKHYVNNITVDWSHANDLLHCPAKIIPHSIEGPRDMGALA
jgi:hypothetical protein